MHLETGVRKVASALYVHLNTPRSLTALILLREKEWDQLVDLTVDPRNYIEGPWGAEKFRRDSQATDFLRKSPLVPLACDRVKAAKEIFDVCERQCFETNVVLKAIRYPLIGDPPIARELSRILGKARKIAGRILGALPSDVEGAFGPGTSFEMRGTTFSTVADKLWIQPHVTPACVPVFEHTYWRTHWGRTRLGLGLPLPTTCRGNRFTTVPKDARKDRGICVEPLGNLWVQLGIGRYLKRRLSRVGLFVDRVTVPKDPIQLLTSAPPFDGQILHRRLAREGSLGRGWATLDLSNASDTVAYELVREVLPPDWFALLDSCRSPFTWIDKTWVKLEKFSSMGNGFTFELETLIFACLIAALTGLEVGTDFYVYGDDIVVPERVASDVSALLKLCGFTLNPKKCFTTGPFRESCGGDFFSGYNVRSYFADGEFESPLEWLSAHNELAWRWGGSTNLASKRCAEQLPSRFRLYGPARLGHRVLWGPWKGYWKDGIRWCKTVNVRPRVVPLERWGSEFTLTLATLGVPSQGLSPRGEILGYHIGKASVS